MPAEDIREIREIQPTGPYTLWGYSFGARVAFEAAYQLEQSGERVRHLCLIAPGSPKVRAEEGKVYGQEASYQNPAYVSILFSVFAGGLHHPALPECLETVQDQQGFVAFIGRHFPDIDSEMAERIVNIVAETFEFSYSFHELSQRKVNAPVTILKASGDDYSFLENATGFSSTDPSVIELVGDHYGLLREEGIEELTEHIRTHSRKEDRL
jgi:thioesterase domain-containing protein